VAVLSGGELALYDMDAIKDFSLEAKPGEIFSLAFSHRVLEKREIASELGTIAFVRSV
jgi:hypothetical protein